MQYLRTAASVSLICIAAVGLQACGSSSGSSASDTETLETFLADEVAAKNKGSKLTNVVCVSRAENEYRCSADFKASLAWAKESIGSIDTSYFSDADWKVLRESKSGPIAYDVSVDPNDGSYVAVPVS